MDYHAIDICLIESDPEQCKSLFEHFLQEQYSIVAAADGREGLQLIRQHRPRVVICDLCASQMDGFVLCGQVRNDATLDGTYLIAVAPSTERAVRQRALEIGVDECLARPLDLDELCARIRNGLRISRLQERLRRAALTDGLTGLWNHAHFRNLLDREFSRTRRYGGTLSLLMIDLDHFKAVNDTYGHEIGNRALTATARHLTRMVREIDIVARYGGEEFSVVCPQTSLDEATRLAERIRQSLSQEVRVPEQPQLVVTASIGVVSSADPQVTSVAELINLADQALYVGKSQGRNQVTRTDQIGDVQALTDLQVCELDRLRKQVVALSMQAKELCLQSVWALVQALEQRDPYTANHSRNTRFYTNALAEAAGWPESLRTATANAAMLHDLGKIGVPDRILQKSEALAPGEAAILRQVPLMTCKILEPLRIFETETLIIRHLRERYDGTGYPDSLAGTNIPIGSRLLSVAEAFDALTSERAYRSQRSVDAAIAEIQAGGGTQFDPQFTSLLVRVVADQREIWQQRVASARTALVAVGASGD